MKAIDKSMSKNFNYYFLKVAMATLLLLFFYFFGGAFAANGQSRDESFKLIAKQIEEIKQKIDLLWLDYFKIVADMPIIKEVQNKFKSDMGFGSAGENVMALQELLSDSQAVGIDIYPEKLKTGYFGKLTLAAVKRFQQKNGLDDGGMVDAATRKVLNNLYLSKAEKDWMKEQNPVDF